VNKPTNKLTASVVILTYNRPEPLSKLLSHLENLNHDSVEVIVVDNNSSPPINGIHDIYPFAKFITLEDNLGIGGRNVGIKNASAPIIITIDDDIIGIDSNDINVLVNIFSDKSIGAVCFKVLNEHNDDIVDWCHHRKIELYHNESFNTAEITEGAVAFRKEIIEEAGLYPGEFFISHEGPDLAFRIMNLGYKVIYDPRIAVRHSRSELARPSWRRYYYDSRNLLWLVVRNYPLVSGSRRLSIGIISLAIYSVRDGFFRFWLKGVYDGIKGIPDALSNRIMLTDPARAMLKDIEKNRPGLLYMIKRRMFKSKIEC